MLYRGSIYQDFGCKMYEMSKRFMILICPDRWNLSNQSKSFELFRSYVLDSNNIDSIVHIASEQGRTYVFGDVSTKELTYFLVDKFKSDDKCRLLEQDCSGKLLKDSIVSIKNPFYYSIDFMNILDKVYKKCNKYLYDNTELVTYSELDTKQFNRGSEFKTDYYNLKAYGTKGEIVYVNKSCFTHNYNSFSKWKVLLARSGTSAIVAEPDSVASRHMYMLYFNTQVEASNCRDYTQTKFFRCLRVNSTAGMASSMDSFKNLPYLDFNKNWTDEVINEYFDFTEDEIKYINNFTH